MFTNDGKRFVFQFRLLLINFNKLWSTSVNLAILNEGCTALYKPTLALPTNQSSWLNVLQ
jgi:hypothetical protein